MERIISLLGLFSMVGFAWMLSSAKRRISLRIVVGGMALQFVLGVFVLKTTPGQVFFRTLGDFFKALLDFVDQGALAVFGENFEEHFFAFKVLSTIIFFSSCMSILYYWGIIQHVVSAMAWIMQKSLGTSGAESLSAAANIFVGQTEAPLVIRPYIATMTRSELMAVMVGGFATIAGSVLAMFVEMEIDAAHLITASVISAPAALLIAKVMQPEVEQPETLGRVEVEIQTNAVNIWDAAARGASDGLKLALNIGAMLIAFLAIFAMLNAFVGWIGRDLFGSEQTWSLETGLGYAFYPFAWLMGIPADDCFVAGTLLGKKMAVNEIVAYGDLGAIRKSAEPILAERSITILTYALCGFANFSSIGIQLGGIGGMAENRRSDLARLGFRAMLGGTLAAFMTACVAGILI